MSVPGGSNPLLLATAAGGGGGYQIERSLRFNSSDSAYLSRTPASAGNRKTWTWAGWVKRSQLSSTQMVFECFNGNNDNQTFNINFGENLVIGGYSVLWLTTTALFRDPSAWYHITLAVDTTQATANNRIRLYVNGSEITVFGTRNNPTLNADLAINQSAAHYIGTRNATTFYLNGYLADIHFIDGQALDPTSFGEFDTNGVWQPKAYTGSYGTNGFHLPFSDNSTAAALGTDTSGNGNTWTVNNISVTAGAGNDSLVDSPTNGSQEDSGAGGEVVGNYATLNPIGGGGGTLANGNLELSTSSTTPGVGTFAMTTGKWYWEVTLSTSSNPRVGVYNIGLASPADLGGTANGWAIINSPSRVFHNGATTSYGSFSGASGNIVMVAYDADLGRIWYGENGTWLASGNPATNSNPSQTSVTGGAIVAASSSGIGSNVHNFNFGQRPFAYTAPSGFKALCTANLPTPTIADGSTAFDTKLWSGNSTYPRSITGLNFSPDLIWLKNRTSAYDHVLMDAIRGTGTTKWLSSNLTSAEGVNFANANVTSLDANGFTIGSTAGTDILNQSGTATVAWTWDAGSSTVTDPNGSIESQVRANVSAGFSVVTYSGNSVAASTVGHGLGVTPSMVIVKRRNSARGWYVSHVAYPNTSLLFLESTSALATTEGTRLQRTNSTVFTVGDAADYGPTNETGGTYVAYCFAPVAGYSSFGSYTGNGSADGSFVYTGMRPRWVLIRRTDTTENWILHDTARDGYNVTTKELIPNSASAEGSTTPFDILSNGFKLRDSGGGTNASGGTYIFAAFAEHPFATSRAR